MQDALSMGADERKGLLLSSQPCFLFVAFLVANFNLHASVHHCEKSTDCNGEHNQKKRKRADVYWNAVFLSLWLLVCSLYTISLCNDSAGFRKKEHQGIP